MFSFCTAVEEKQALGKCPCCIDGRFRVVSADCQDRTAEQMSFAELFSEEHPVQVTFRNW